MVRFRVPTASLSSDALASTQDVDSQVCRSPTTQTKPAVQATKPHKAHARSRPSRARLAHKLDKAKAAAKEAAERAHRTKKLAEPCIAYVGNIGPDVDENALMAHFSRCGKILSVRIHCCGGVVMTVKPPPASYHQNLRVRQYGIITFASKLARQRACKLGGTLGGCELTVSILISELPEVREKIAHRLKDYQSRLEPPDVHRAQKSALRSLKLDPTVLLDPAHENEQRLRKRFRCFGYSLVEGIA